LGLKPAAVSAAPSFHFSGRPDTANTLGAPVCESRESGMVAGCLPTEPIIPRKAYRRDVIIQNIQTGG
jgi:hypothetical protein